MNEAEPTMHDSDEPTTQDSSNSGEERDIVRELEEWKDTALRTKADFENLRRRMLARESELQMMAAERVLHKLLPIIDDLHHAVDAASATRDIDALLAGLSMIHDKAHRLLESEGVTTITVEPGEPFDVNVHEALLSQPSDLPEGHVVAAFQRGYRLHERVLRHAKVVTSAGSGTEGVAE